MSSSAAESAAGRRNYVKDWKPKNEEEQAYYSLNKESTKQSAGLYKALVEPALVTVGLQAVSDASYGRRSLPLSPAERTLRQKRGIVVQEADVYISKPKEKGSADSSKSAPRPLHSQTGTAWTHYAVYRDETAKERLVDLVICHGINEYGGKWTRHMEPFLRAGYRIILPDLPSHGRSSGLHAYLYDLDVLADALHAVICDVRHKDAEQGDTRKRKLFVAGQSMGGFTVLDYAVKYTPQKPQSSPYAIEKGAGPRPVIDGVLALCPMLGIQQDSRPHWVVERIARTIASFGGRVAMIDTIRGKESYDPNVPAEAEEDPQGYHGAVRIGTALAILKSIDDVNARLEEVTVPLFICHGDCDRITSPSGSKQLYERASTKDKELHIAEGEFHVLFREGRDAEDDKPRQKLIKQMLEWIDARAD